MSNRRSTRSRPPAPATPSSSRPSPVAKLEQESYTLGGSLSTMKQEVKQEVGLSLGVEVGSSEGPDTSAAGSSGSSSRRIARLPARGPVYGSSSFDVKTQVKEEESNYGQPQFATSADSSDLKQMFQPQVPARMAPPTLSYDNPDLEPDDEEEEEWQKPKAKKARKKADSKVEKRMSRLREKCPKAVLERLERMRSQRMFLVDRERDPEGAYEILKILGSTGNVYTINISLTPRCDCPDGQKNGTCKHILFAMLKVLQVPDSSTFWYQKSLLTTELAWIFANSPPSPQAAALASGECSECPVCYDELEANEKNLYFCLVAGGCGKALHKECATRWTDTQKAKGEEVTCVWCRSLWGMTLPATGPSSGAMYSDGYLNLGAQAGMSRKRDTSSYYRGPRRGQRYDPLEEMYRYG